MQKNIGNTDKLIRLVIILLISLFSYMNLAPQKILLAFLIFAIYLLITTLTKFSLIYKILDIDTLPKKK